ncbi:GGDEF-domain containing protein [Blastococcus sp. TBT05-19]|uniref:putative bifunctional diguanylate cyclase/phosphodiesterase n=1 Tax=Blastococcus sp. TBT05-19 TaxID=2250581 RepID=UPI000DEA7224|nr:EAL domain-containing protein [Blastococcus sp. TBT05-19]RBY94447.1 GGDEF-domain containing protein [Blastococcus sp. TBT05-19]
MARGPDIGNPVREQSGGRTVGDQPTRSELPEDARRPGVGRSGDGALVAAVLDALPSPTLLVDADGRVRLTNLAWRAAADSFGDPRFEVGLGGDYFGLALDVMRDEQATRGLIEDLRRLSRGELDSVSADYALPTGGGTRWYHLMASRVDQAGHIVVTHSDVTSRVQAERTSAWQARHDSLTELPNRAHLHELIDQELQRPDAPAVAVLFLDVDGFKDVNDSLGHDAGDELLRQLAARLTAVTRGQDTVGRLGGDEFVVLSRDCDLDGAEMLAQRCQVTFDQPFELGGRMVRLSASIGIAAAPGGRTTLRSTDLVRDADLAMYAAKAAGRNRVRVFSPELGALVQGKVQMASELRDAIEDGQLVLHYQPILHVPTGEYNGCEALVRWQHPERGLLPPGDFLPVAEQYDLLVPLTRWVLREVGAQHAAWRAQDLDLVIGVNVHARHLSTGTLVDDVLSALEESGMPPSNLVCELTETSVAEDPECAASQLAELRRRGVEVSIDDFGSGFSSLGQLVNLPTGVLKIDRSLVAFTEGRESHAAAAIAAIVALARACGSESLAEGVETAGQLALATELGCTFAQGYHLARPMPAAELPAWMAARGGGRRRHPGSVLPAGKATLPAG